MLTEVKPNIDHALDAVDITDPEHQEWWDRYKYDIPVLHVNGQVRFDQPFRECVCLCALFLLGLTDR